MCVRACLRACVCGCAAVCRPQGLDVEEDDRPAAATGRSARGRGGSAPRNQQLLLQRALADAAAADPLASPAPPLVSPGPLFTSAPAATHAPAPLAGDTGLAGADRSAASPLAPLSPLLSFARVCADGGAGAGEADRLLAAEADDRLAALPWGPIGASVAADPKKNFRRLLWFWGCVRLRRCYPSPLYTVNQATR
jgi:hypothetical protein